MGTVLLGVLLQGLQFAVAKEGNKHLDMLNKALKLKKEYYEELEREDAIRSQLTLDRLLRDIYLLAESFSRLPIAK